MEPRTNPAPACDALVKPSPPADGFPASRPAGFCPGPPAGMIHMFNRARSFNQPLNNWNVSKVESMVGMFDEATSFNQPLHAPWYAVEQSDSE